MPEFIIEQYEIHIQKVKVKADDRAKAVIALLNGEGETIDDGGEYLEVAEDISSANLFNQDELDEINLTHCVDWENHAVGSIRSIEEE